MHHKYYNNNVIIEYNMIICSSSNIDIIQGNIGYNDPEGITDWRITNTASGSSGTLNILNSLSQTGRVTILDNGNLGIANTNPGSLLDVGGDVNITGIYKRNNRDIISDTSNYALSTSNILVPRILTEVGFGSNYTSRLNTALNTRIDNTSNYVLGTSNLLANRVSSQWTSVSSGIHYTPMSITSSPIATTGTTSNYTYQIFTYTTETAGAGTGQSLYTINVPTTGIVCDILMVAGGGSGGGQDAGGGGAGGLVLVQNITLSGNFTIKVGNGGIVTSAGWTGGVNGKNTTFTKTDNSIIITANGGGGGGGGGQSTGGNGGSGGGGGMNVSNGSQTQKSQSQIGIVSPATINQFGENGGHGGGGGASYPGGGGGGAGSVGATSSADETGQNGGLGIDRVGTYIFKDNFNSSIGDNGWFAGGGGSAGGYANTNYAYGNGGSTLFGGGGNGDGVGRGINGINGTGGGGGGIRYNPSVFAGNGGSGIVIIRYLSPTNVGIGTTSPTTKLHVYDDTTNNTTLTVQNNYIDPVVIYPNTVGYTATETLESSKFYRTLTFNYFPNYPENPPNTALLAWYRFDGDGLDYNPYATKYNLETNSGTPTYSSGTSADSFFQGRRYLVYSSSSLRNTALQLSYKAFSVALWVRPRIGNGTYIYQHQFHNTGGTLYLGTASWSTQLQYGIDSYNQGAYSETYFPGDLNNWVHLVYIMNTNYGTSVYRNGLLIANNNSASTFVGTGNLQVLSTGADISDLRIYNNGLSATEVATLYNSYTSLVITDNYAINFNKSSTVLVNSVSKTVNGLYNISMGHINSSILPAAGQADTPLASTETTSVAIKYEYSNTSTSLPNLITVAGATSSIIGTTERAISFTYTSDSSGLTGQTQYSFTPTEDLWCDILVVGGGGGGGCFGGGGGGGAVLFGTNLKINAGNSVSVKVGNGGTGATTANSGINGINGFNSSITINLIEYIALGGGGGGSRNNNPYGGKNGNDGGSGGGGSTGDNNTNGLAGISNKNIYANFQSFGNNGGNGNIAANPWWVSGGGGGAGSKGSDFTLITGGGNGGQGKDFITYFGTNVGHNGYFAGGGGGNTYGGQGNRGYGNGGNGLYGGGGDAGFDGTLEYSANNGLLNTGGGGGGGKYDGTTSGSVSGGTGGSGFIIIRYRRNRMQSAALELIRSTNALLPNELAVTGATGAAIGTTDRYISFPYTSDSAGLTGQTQYTLMTTEPLICDILIVGGGGGGGNGNGIGYEVGGGGAGGIVYMINKILPVGTYKINVGKGGTGGVNGYNSSITDNNNNTLTFDSKLLIGKGGGYGGFNNVAGIDGGSGGGGAHYITNGGLATQGDTFWNGTTYIAGGFNGAKPAAASRGGGGGGASEIGDADGAGFGGDGREVNITGTSTFYAGGGNAYPNTSTTRSDGGGGTLNGGGAAQSGGNALPNTGSGGAGALGSSGAYVGGTGGTGIVIIRYRKANINYKIGNYGGDFKIISSTYSSTSTISQDTDYMRITRDGASIYNPTGSPQWSTTSDRRIKENIEKASYTKCYDNINKLELYRFNYIKDFNNINKDLRQLGYIAQEVNDIFPKAVTAQHFNNQNLSVPDLLTIDITQINYSLYGAVKKLIEMYNDIGKKINVLEKLLNIDTSASDLITADEISTSNVIITEASTSNLTTDTSNLIITDTSNVIINDTSNVIITYTSNLTTDTSNVIITEASTSNLIITEASTSNLITDTSNVIITEVSTSNLTQDAS